MVSRVESDLVIKMAIFLGFQPIVKIKEFILSLIGYIALKHARDMLISCNSRC